MFFGRETELKKLNDMYNSEKFECAIIYGRRRVGKTTLIREFCRDKKYIYFVAREASGEVNLANFGKDIYSSISGEQAGNSFFDDWDKAFNYIYQISMDERIILVIDEYPYLAGGYPAISSMLQAKIDIDFINSKLFLILCGSSMSFMEYQVLGYKSPLYGRRTAQFKINPFNFFDSLYFLNGFDKKDQAVLYGVTDGIPEYLIKIKLNRSVQENITDLFLTPSGHLYEEPSNLLKQELREPSIYNGIIEAIAKGASKLNEIATKCNMESNKCSKYLTSLIVLGIVKKDIPIGESFSKKSIYLLNDQMFRFWYRFVFPNMSNIEAGFGERVYDHDVKPQLNAYMGLIFENICKDYLFKLMKKDKLPFFIGQIGRWWGNNPNLKRQEEIDIMSFRDDDALFCECKWTNDNVDVDVLNDLISQGELFHYKNKYFYVFSKSGFTNKIKEVAKKQDNIYLISFEEMVSE